MNIKLSGYIKKAFLTAATISAALLITSCPPQVTPDMVSLVEDQVPPAIVLSSPKSGDNYYSSVTVTGVITDAVTEDDADNTGRITSIYYTIANDTTRRGKIDIGLDDEIVKNTSFGSGDIEYDLTTGEFSFNFSTMLPTKFRDQISITVTAVDSNENTTEQDLDLKENEGPYVDFDFYSSSSFVEANKITSLSGTEVYIEGTIGNSEYETEAADEIVSLEWGIFGTFWGGNLDLTDGSANWDENLQIFRSLNNDEDYFFDYNPNTRTFNTHQYIELDTGKYFYVEAIDAYGHVTNVQKLLSPPALLTLSRPNVDVPYYSPTYSANLIVDSKIIDPNDGVLSVNDVGTVSYEFQAVEPGDITALAGASAVELYSNPTFDQAIYDSFFDSEGAFSFTVDTTALVGIGLTGDINVRVIVTDAEDTIIPKKNVLLENDAIVPGITVNSFADDNSDNYVKRGDGIVLSFTASDADSGIKTASLVNQITGEVITGTAVETSSTVDPDTGKKTTVTFTTDFIVPDTAVSATSGDLLGYSILLTDNVGNIATKSAADLLTFYSPYNNDSFTGSVSYISDNLRDGIYYGRATDTAHDKVTINFTSSRVLSGTPTATVAGQTATVTSLGGLNYKVEYTLASSILNEHDYIPFIINIEDKAGNADTITESDTSTSIIYDDVIPGTPAVPVYTGNNGDLYINDIEADSVAMTVNYSSATVVTGDTVQLYLDDSTDVLLGEATSSGGSSSSIAVTSRTLIDPSGDGSSDGSKSFYAKVIDAAGNIGSNSANLTGISLDTTEPVISINGSTAYGNSMPFYLSVNTSDSDIDSSTYAWTISGTGTAPNTSGATVNAADTATATVTIYDFTFDSTYTDNADGEYTAELNVSDNAGNPAATASHTFIYDENVFTQTVTGFPSSTYTGSSITLATTPAGDECGIASYLWEITSSPAGADNMSLSTSGLASTAFDADTDGSDDGIYIIRITTTDNLARSVSYQNTFNWETAAPTWVSANPGSIGSVNDTAHTITAEATDTGSLLHDTLPYQWTIDGPGGADSTQNSDVLSFSGFTVNGSYTASCVAQDNAGNTTDPADQTVNYIWDTTSPVITVTSRSPDPSSDVYLKNNDTVTITFTVVDALSSVQTPTATIMGNTALIGGTGPYTATYNITETSSSDAGDTAGYVLNGSDVIAYGTANTVQLSASPYTFYGTYSASCNSSISVTSSNGNYLKSGDTLTIVYESTRQLSSTGKSASIQDGSGHSSNADSTTVSGSTFTAVFNIDGTEGLDTGTIDYNVGFQDAAGNTFSASVVSTSITYDCTAPGTPTSLSWTTASDDGYINSSEISSTSTTVEIAYDSSVVSGDTIELYIEDSSGTSTSIKDATDSDFTADGTSPDTLTFNCSTQLASITDGTGYFLKARIKDAAGNYSSYKNTSTFEVDTSIATPVIASTGTYKPYHSTDFTLSNSTSYTSENSTSFAWEITHPDTSTTAGTATTFVTVATTTGSEDLLLASDGTDDGTYTADLIVTDDAGNTASAATYTFYWDALQFTVDSFTQNDTGYYNTSDSSFELTANITGDESGISQYTWTDNGSSKVSCTANVNPTTVTMSSTLSDGTYTITLVATDNLGRSNTAATVDFVYDKTAPAISSTATTSGSLDGSADYVITASVTETYPDTYTWSISPVTAFSATDNVLTVTSYATTTDYTATLTVTDLAGNSSSQNFTFTTTGARSLSQKPSATLLTGGTSGSSSSGGSSTKSTGSSSSSSRSTGRMSTYSYASTETPAVSVSTTKTALSSQSFSRPALAGYTGGLFNRTGKETVSHDNTGKSAAADTGPSAVETTTDDSSTGQQASAADSASASGVPAAASGSSGTVIRSAAASAAGAVSHKIGGSTATAPPDETSSSGWIWLLLIIPAAGAFMLFRKKRLQ